MSRGIFITATGTDVGKTYVTALLAGEMKRAGMQTGYYKAAISGADSIEESDAGYVNRTGGIGQKEDTLVSYLYHTAVSPHLASQIEGTPAVMKQIVKDYRKVQEFFDYVLVEGSGGIVCPIRYDDTAHIFLEDIIRALGLSVLVVADAGLGTINATVLTVDYLQKRNIHVRGIILNRYTGSIMQKDNRKMIEEITGLPVILLVPPDAVSMDLGRDVLLSLFGEEET